MDPLNAIGFHEVESRECLKHSVAFLIGRLLHILFYVVAILTLGWTFLPLYCCIVGTTLQAVAVYFAWRWERREPSAGTPMTRFSWLCSPQSAIAIALVVDAGLIAMTRLDVQNRILENFRCNFVEHLFGTTDGIECLGSASQFTACYQHLRGQSVSTTQVFQFVIFYYMMFVLEASYAWICSGLCVVVYSVITLASTIMSVQVFSIFEHTDLMILISSYAMSAIAANKMRLAKHALLRVLEKQHQNLVQEKVLRCQAEFTCEQLVLQCDKMQGDQNIAALANPSGSTTASSVSQAPSADTAPAAFTGKQQDCKNLCPKGSGDCLPATAVAWVDSCQAPLPLADIKPGQRILCYDNVAGGLTYSTVRESNLVQDSSSTDWIEITLKDGTELHMTADHPVSVQSSLQHDPERHQATGESSRRHSRGDMSRQCVRAAELNVTDCLMVLKLVATPVANIVKMAADSACETEKQWITVTIQQPERYELFVAMRNKLGMPGMPIAVGSSDRLPSFMPRTRWFTSGIEKDADMPKRTGSAPPTLRVHDFIKQSSDSIPLNGRQPNFVKQSSESDNLSTISGSTISSPESASSESLADVKIGSSIQRSKDDIQVASLADFMHSKSAGLSIGSIHRSLSECSPCSFYFTWMHNPSKRPCKASHMCEYCHDISHQPNWRSKLRKCRRPATAQDQDTSAIDAGDESAKTATGSAQEWTDGNSQQQTAVISEPHELSEPPGVWQEELAAPGLWHVADTPGDGSQWHLAAPLRPGSVQSSPVPYSAGSPAWAPAPGLWHTPASAVFTDHNLHQQVGALGVRPPRRPRAASPRLPTPHLGYGSAGSLPPLSHTGFPAPPPGLWSPPPSTAPPDDKFKPLVDTLNDILVMIDAEHSKNCKVTEDVRSTIWGIVKAAIAWKETARTVQEIEEYTRELHEMMSHITSTCAAPRKNVQYQ